MEARPPALIHKPQIEPLSPYTMWLFIANLFFVGIFLMVYMGIVQRFIRLCEPSGICGQYATPTQVVTDISKFMDQYWHLSFLAVGLMIIISVVYLFFYERRDGRRKWILFSISLVLVCAIAFGVISIFLPHGPMRAPFSMMGQSMIDLSPK